MFKKQFTIVLTLLFLFIGAGCSSENLPTEDQSKMSSSENSQSPSIDEKTKEEVNSENDQDSKEQPEKTSSMTGFSEKEKSLASEYPETMEQCMFIDKGEVTLTEDGTVLASILIREDMPDDFREMRMEQHITKLSEEYPTRRVELKAVFEDGTVAATALAEGGTVSNIDLDVN